MEVGSKREIERQRQAGRGAVGSRAAYWRGRDGEGPLDEADRFMLFQDNCCVSSSQNSISFSERQVNNNRTTALESSRKVKEVGVVLARAKEEGWAKLSKAHEKQCARSPEVPCRGWVQLPEAVRSCGRDGSG